MAIAEPEAEPVTTPEPDDLLGEPVGLELTNVVRIHRMGEVAVNALRGISLRIAPGEFVAVMGPSGCGKSTLLSLIGGLDRPTDGTVVAGGRKLSSMRDRQLADYRLQHVGTIFQSFNLITSMSALDNVALPMALGGVPAGKRRERSRKLLEEVGLKDRVAFRPTRLSGGEQQRVSVARALANRPGLILADEPTGNLDEEAGQGVLQLVKEMHGRGATVVMVTHDPDVASIAIFISAPYATSTGYWDRMAKANQWTADEYNSITLISDSSGSVDAVAKEVKDLGYQATTSSDFLKGFGQFITYLTLGLSGLAAIALIVACLGIANTMYTAVLERTREIGILKALGARSGDALSMFMAEAAMIGLIGGTVGLLIAAGVSAGGNVIVNNIAASQGIPLDLSVFRITVLLVAGALALATVFSALSGFFPALQASRLDPVTALRYE